MQRGLAIACKTVIQARIARNISEAYLGRQTGEKVLEGSIRLGDGEQTRALVWYSDLRSSTRLAETMPSADFLALLNVYFECAARPIIAAGGEVLAFVGDAVLAMLAGRERLRASRSRPPRGRRRRPVSGARRQGQRRARGGEPRADRLRHRPQYRHGDVRQYRRSRAAGVLGGRPDGDRGRPHREAHEIHRVARVGDARHRIVRAAPLALDRRAQPRRLQLPTGALRLSRDGSGSGSRLALRNRGVAA